MILVFENNYHIFNTKNFINKMLVNINFDILRVRFFITMFKILFL